MLVDNPLLYPSLFSAASAQSSSYPEDFSDIFDTDLFNSTFATTSSTSSGSRASTPQNLLTPPQVVLPTSFPEIHDDDTTNQFYALFDDDLKAMNNPLALTSADFMGINGFDGSYDGVTGRGGASYNIGYGIGMDVSNMGMSIPPIDDPMQMTGIDPQLVDTPSAVSDQDDEPEEEQEPSSPADVVEQPEQEKLTFTIAPVKVGGFGKARKGTVQSGGVVKKTPSAYINKDKENPTSTNLPSSKKSAPPNSTKLSPTSLTNTSSVSGLFLTGDNSVTGGSEAGDRDDEDDLPQDWRPSPEVLAKMTSKEKRQLRNKISARNFRVRRKEYITTLEGDIAERDRLLDHFRTKLGSQESENVALRQEIATLKKALLEGRGGPINLPPPAPLPEQSAAETLAASTLAASNTNINTSIVQSAPLLTANTQKDLPTAPRLGGPGFWGGVGMGGGVTPVHTTLVPDISTIVRNGLQENINPSLNAMRGASVGNGIGSNKALGLGGFDGFSDLNPFTMKTLDAYRMHLWGKMASQQQMHQQNLASQSQQNPSGLASNFRPHHFFSPSPKPNLPPSSGYGSTISALLSGKHNVPYSNPSSNSSYPTLPPSPLLHLKGGASLPLLPSANPSSTSSFQKEREKEHQHAMLAAMASQTVFRKLGNAFWDAFTGSSSSSSSTSRGDWDADKVRKILEGKAVLRVVDVEPTTIISTATSATVSSAVNGATPPASPKMHHSWAGAGSRSQGRSTVTSSTPSSSSSNSSQVAEDCGNCSMMACKTTVCEILEESMRSLSLGKKM